MVEWLSFASTLVLVGVTAWYAVLTRSLAISAKESAESARAAAEFAARSVAAAVASVDVEFECTPFYSLDGERFELGVQVVSEGATVFVHGAFLLSASECIEHTSTSSTYDSILHEPEGRTLDTASALPARLHKGEALLFEPTPPILLEKDVAAATMAVRVLYSLDGEGPAIKREVEWHGEADRDFTVRKSGGEAALDLV